MFKLFLDRLFRKRRILSAFLDFAERFIALQNFKDDMDNNVDTIIHIHHLEAYNSHLQDLKNDIIKYLNE